MNEDKKIFSKIGINYLILAILTVIAYIILINIVAVWNFEIANNYNIQTVLSSISGYIIMLPIFIILMKRIDSVKIEKKHIDIKTFFKYICITITLMWMGNIIGTAITSLIGISMAKEVINPVEQVIQNSSIYINLIIISIIAPIFEEIFFRKILIDRTIRYGAKLSILLSALMFALFHGNLSQFFYAFFIGLLFSYVYIKTGKIIYPIILHGIINFYGSVASTFLDLARSNIADGISLANTGDILIISLYFFILLIACFVGLYEILTKYNSMNLDDSKREVYLKKPVRTVILNTGMILFIAYHILRIIKSLNII